jgi:hypothetical protein
MRDEIAAGFIANLKSAASGLDREPKNPLSNTLQLQTDLGDVHLTLLEGD